MDLGQFSKLLDVIYGCALDPQQWPAALERLCYETNCLAGTILSTDLVTRQVRHFFSWNFSNEVLEKIAEHGDESAKVWRTLPRFWVRDLDEPGTSMREAPVTYGKSRWVETVMTPLGIVDSLHLILLRTPRRVADLALFRHESGGYVGDRELSVLRLLAPHLRRAVEIGNALDMRSLEGEILGAAFDELPVGIFIVDRKARVERKNAMAQRLVEQGTAVRQAGDVLSGSTSATTAALRQAVADASNGARRALELLRGEHGIELAYVLPLLPQAGGRPGQAGENILIVVPTRSPEDRGSLDLAAEIFGLSGAERKLLPYLLSGNTLSAVAREMALSESTIKTQRMSIFAKTGVSTRADLTRLMAQFFPC